MLLVRSTYRPSSTAAQATHRHVPIRFQLVEVLLPFLGVGSTALAARLLTTDSPPAGVYLVATGLAFTAGLWRPGWIGTLSAWLGWSAGVALGWLIDAGDLFISGPFAYAAVVAMLPHAAGSAIRLLLGRASAHG